MSRRVQRCRHCRSEKGRTHKPFCRTNTETDIRVTDIYVTSIESSSGGGGGCTDSSPSDCGGSGGE